MVSVSEIVVVIMYGISKLLPSNKNFVIFPVDRENKFCEISNEKRNAIHFSSASDIENYSFTKNEIIKYFNYPGLYPAGKIAKK